MQVTECDIVNILHFAVCSLKLFFCFRENCFLQIKYIAKCIWHHINITASLVSELDLVTFLFQACLFVNVSPDVNNFSETVSTLNFGSNAKQIALGQAKQNIKKGPQWLSPVSGWSQREHYPQGSTHHLQDVISWYL